MLIDSKNRQQCATAKPAITYPCVWPYKVIGADADALARAINAVCPTPTAITPPKTSSGGKSGGKYCSLNVEIEVVDEASRLAIYQNLSALQIIFLFFLQENNLRKALIPFIGVKNHLAIKAVL